MTHRTARRSMRPTVLLAATVVMTGGLALLPSAASAAPLPGNCAASTTGTVTCTFGFTGAPEAFAVPSGVTAVAVQATGGAGGASTSPSGTTAGGRGDAVTATLATLPGATLYVVVGADGQSSSTGGTSVSGGFNGGGSALASGSPGTGGGAGGGGASDVRTDPADLTTRLVVAAGGGGAGGTGGATFPGGAGGDAGAPGGGALGCTPSTAAQPGTATAGGAGGTGCAGPGFAGGPGLGADSPPSIFSANGGAGGGGLFGGGSGAQGAPSTPPGSGGGAGGSSLVPAGGTQQLTSAPAGVTLSYLVAPAAPTAVTTTPGDGTVQVGWTTGPVDTSGTPAAGYTATAAPGGASCTTTGTSCLLTGLVNGTRYSITVVATNGAGSSAAAAGPDAVPFGAPVLPGPVTTAAPLTAATSRELAATGSPVGGLAVAAVLLVGVGGLTLTVGRRRTG